MVAEWAFIFKDNLQTINTYCSTFFAFVNHCKTFVNKEEPVLNKNA